MKKDSIGNKNAPSELAADAKALPPDTSPAKKGKSCGTVSWLEAGMVELSEEMSDSSPASGTTLSTGIGEIVDAFAPAMAEALFSPSPLWAKLEEQQQEKFAKQQEVLAGMLAQQQAPIPPNWLQNVPINYYGTGAGNAYSGNSPLAGPLWEIIQSLDPSTSTTIPGCEQPASEPCFMELTSTEKMPYVSLKSMILAAQKLKKKLLG